MSARGFKSFADRVTLEFEPGISVIVGPNGSGKSNIADAVLWVLGEQSPRNLRGSRMEDVIFSGSATRQPLNMAEVSLALDNSRGGIAIDFPEVVVTRRILRSGESEYLLNNAPCRLVDIQEILSDLGVGRELTAVVGQNRLESILRSGAEERRVFIEEAAGLRKHRRRKEKALRKMEAMERNLVRVKDIISEVNKQLRPLERQAQQAQECNELTSEIRDLSIRLLVAEMQELRREWEDRLQEEGGLQERLDATTAEVRGNKERQAGLELEIKGLRASLEACRDRDMRLLALRERLRACEHLGRERLRLYGALSGEGGGGERWRSRREEAEEKRVALEGELAGTLEEINSLEEEAGSLREDLRRMKEELVCAREAREALRRSLQESKEHLKEIAGRAAKERELAAALAEEAGKADSELESLEAEREDLEEEIGRKEAELKEGRKRLRELEERMAAAREDIARREEELAALSRRQRESFQKEALVTARLRALQEVFDSHIDYSATAVRILERSGAGSGVRGLLLHEVRIEERWEKALESYLGPWLFSLVVEKLSDALVAVRALKEEEGGFAIFLPLGELEDVSMKKKAAAVKAAGGVSALTAVHCSPEIRPALVSLLGDVVLCGDLAEAESRAAVHPELTFVTADGDVVAPRRAVKGGARRRSPFHVVARRREMDELREKAALCGREAAELEVMHDSLSASVSGLRGDLEGMAEDRRRLEGEIREGETVRQALSQRRDKNEEAAGRVREKAEAMRRRLAGLEESIRGLSEEEEKLREALRGAEAPLREAESRVEELRARERRLAERLQELQAREASLRERRYHLEQRIAEQREEEGRASAPARGEIASMVSAQERLLDIIAALCEAHGRLEGRLREQEETTRTKLAEAEAELEALRERLEELEESEAELREMVHHGDLASTQLKMRVDMLVQRLLEEFKLPLETAVTEYLPTAGMDEMRARLERLERRREALGQVNPRAVEEYQALKERHAFLMEQVEDLRESKASLLKVVRAIDREIIRIFKETFEEVNVHFQELFERLFPQGRAELSLSDPTDLLNTGVEIEAQPRGKRLRKLTLLSGGETALISLAFLFAIFKTRPSPFYFLDEVEAALDDVNLHRFLNMLREFKGDSQLVVITHQKRTMEIADIIYGVSMQASGISRVVSQKLSDSERLERTGIA